MAHEDERNVMLIKFSIFINNEFSINPYKREITEKDIDSFISTLPEEKEEVLKDWTTCSNYKTTCCGLGVGGKCPCFSYSVRFNPNNQ